MTEARRTSRGRVPLFVARDTYRRRRLVDAARALPLFGLGLWLLPLLWRSPEAPMAASTVLVYIFAVWFGLVIGAVTLIVLHRRLSHLAQRGR